VTSERWPQLTFCAAFAHAFSSPALWTKCSILLMEILSELPGFRKCSPRCVNLNPASASQSPRTREAVSSAYLHLPHPGMSTSPSLNRCLFKWQCPVSSLVNILGWFWLKYLHMLRAFLNDAFFFICLEFLFHRNNQNLN